MTYWGLTIETRILMLKDPWQAVFAFLPLLLGLLGAWISLLAGAHLKTGSVRILALQVGLFSLISAGRHLIRALLWERDEPAPFLWAFPCPHWLKQFLALACLALAREADQITLKAANLLRLKNPLPHMRIRLFPSPEEKQACLGNGEVINFNPDDKEIDWAFVSPFQRLEPATLVRFLLQMVQNPVCNSILESGMAERISQLTGTGVNGENEEINCWGNMGTFSITNLCLE